LLGDTSAESPLSEVNMAQRIAGLQHRIEDALREVLFVWPWYIIAAFFRVFYGFRVEGVENVPRNGPFLVLINEFSVIATIVSGWISLVLLKKHFKQAGENTVAYMQEELWSTKYFASALGDKAHGRYKALLPTAADRLALNLMDGYETLKTDGIVVLNPEGDASWDGRPLPMGESAAWLGLHTAAPIVPTLCAIGAYDIWPRWQALPARHGDLVLRIGKPFRLTEKPQDRVSPRDMEAATERLKDEFNRLRYGSQGVEGWMGPITLKGRRMADGAALPIRQPLLVRKGPMQPQAPLKKRDMAMLLWRCPVCQTNDSIVTEQSRFGGKTLHCRACGTVWQVRHVPGKDFQLKVVAGDPALVGLEMGLSRWYEEMKRQFRLEPIAVEDPNLAPGEQVYLVFEGSDLIPYRPNPLFEEWNEVEAPYAQERGQRKLADWGKIGTGRLLMTDQRLLWESDTRVLEFRWSRVAVIYLWLSNILGIRYGMNQYRFKLGEEAGLKWLTYAHALARQAQGEKSKLVGVSAY
jgi:1-acyl-sn-glycerol-3-phosphate acyltransferase